MHLLGHAQSVAVPNDWREITSEDQIVVGVLRLAHESDRAAVGVIKVQPLEAGVIEIDFVKRGLARVETIQLRDICLKPPMSFIIEQVPVETALMVPFDPLAEFAAHEQE